MDNKREVQEYLIALRARITPEAAGLTVFGGERRVPGLRREEVAQVAGISTAYYTRMERGDLSGVSESVLYALVRALQLNEAETTHLFDLAHAASGPRPRSRSKAAPRISERLAMMLETMRDVPAISLTRLGDPAASNALGRALFPHLFPEGRPPLNHTRYLFLDPRSQEFYPDWETSARETVSSLRLMAGQDPADRALMNLVGELSTHSTEFRAWWSGHTVRLHTSGTKRINHPIVGELTIGYDVLTIEATPGLRITTYLPEPGTASADALDMLRSWVAGQEREGISGDRHAGAQNGAEIGR
ncbi:MAG TPA: helix-turn-helix transcriptional regulator [Arachnia sp.]|nr:helix-turn-helix transcriptional regulator [Arachnia sp.]HMT87862.1 helix-turn-helix transcriptional regulator [Arachnia sp.]